MPKILTDNETVEQHLVKCRALDAADPLACIRDEFVLPEGRLYLDGNSLGAMPKRAVAQVAKMMEEEWGRGQVTSWTQADWFDLPTSLGDRIGGLIGAGPGQVVATDTISANLFKAVCASVRLQKGRVKLVSDRANFPADLYILQGIRDLLPEIEIKLIGRDGTLAELVDERTIAVVLTQVDFRDGACLDMVEVTRIVQAKGALMIWDLAHSAGAVSVALDACGVDFAVGCTYKYLNAGPGAPAFLYVARSLQSKAISPIYGWIGHEDPFSFSPEYLPTGSVRRFLSGTPAILSYIPLKASLEIWESVTLADVWHKRDQLTALFIEAVQFFDPSGMLRLASPREPALRGSQVALRHPSGLAIMRALIARGVVGDFRAPDILRFGFTPLTLSYEEVWRAASMLGEVLATEEWRKMSNAADGAVT